MLPERPSANLTALDARPSQRCEKRLGILESDDTADLFATAEEDDPGRAKQIEAFEQRLVIRVVRRHVSLKQGYVLELLHDGRIRECEMFHFFARDAPVSVKVKHDRPAALRNNAIEICDRFDARELQRRDLCGRCAAALEAPQRLKDIAASFGQARNKYGTK